MSSTLAPLVARCSFSLAEINPWASRGAYTGTLSWGSTNGTAQHYLPEYLWTTEGIEFDAHPYNDTNPPAVIVPGTQDALLLPAPRYPFSAGLRVLRGQVFDNTGAPAPDTLVSLNPTERVLTDAAGSYRLPLRWPALNANVVIDATSIKLGQANNINVNLPADLTMVQNIQLL